MKTEANSTDVREVPREGGQRIKTSLAPFAAWAVAMAVLVAVAYLVPAIQRSLVLAPLPYTVTVGSRESDMRQAVRAEFVLDSPEELVSRTSGVVSSVWISPGDAVKSGERIISVNGVQINAFGQDVPLYRPLSRGDRGTDVAALRRFLSEQGLLESSGETERFDWTVAEAVRKYQLRVGAPVDGVFLPEYVMFLPRGFTLADTVQVRVGDLISSGEVVASAPPSVVQARFLPGAEGDVINDFGSEPLVFSVDDRRVPLSSLEPTGDELLELQSLVTSMPRTQEQGQPVSSVILEGFLSLQEPRSFGVVPSGSIYLAQSGAKCLFVLRDGRASSGLAARETENAAIAFGELGAAYVDPELAGLDVVRDPTALDSESIALCT